MGPEEIVCKIFWAKQGGNEKFAAVSVKMTSYYISIRITDKPFLIVSAAVDWIGEEILSTTFHV